MLATWVKTLYKACVMTQEFIRVLTWRHSDHIGVRNNETAAKLVNQKVPVGIYFFSREKSFFYSKKLKGAVLRLASSFC